MANIRMQTTFAGDLATLSASPAVAASMPVTNLLNMVRYRVMRTTGLADQQIKGTLASPALFSMMWLILCNLTGLATIRVQIYTDAAWTTLAYDSGVVAALQMRPLSELVWGVDPLGMTYYSGFAKANAGMYFTPVGGQSFTITISDPNNPAGFMEVSRLLMGGHFEFAYNPKYGMKFGWDENTNQQRSDGGSLRSVARANFRKLSIDFSLLPDSDRHVLSDLYRNVGKIKDFLVSVYPGSGGAYERDYTMQAKMVGSLPDIVSDVPLRNSSSLTIQEV